MKKLAFLLALVVFAAIAFGVAYTDVPEDHWAYDAVMKATSAGLLQGFPDGTFRGDEALTRYQLAESIAKLLDYSESGDAKLQELVFALTKKVASLSLEISDVKKSVIDIMAEFRSLEGKVAEIDLDSVEQKVWELREDVFGELNNVKMVLDAYDSQFEALNGKVTDLEVTTKLLGQSLAKFKDDFAAYMGKVDAIEGKMVTSEQLDQKLSLLYTKILKLSSQLKEIDAVKEEFANYVTVKDYETTVAIVNKLTRDVFKLYRSKADVEDLKACNDSIAALESLLDSNVADLNDSINVVYDQVDANINSIMDIEKKLSDIEGKLSMFAETGDVEALKEKVTNLEVTSKMLSSSVVKLNETVANLNFVTPDQLSEKMGFLYKKLGMTESKLSDRLGSLEASVASLNDDVEVAFDQIDANIFDIMALESKLADLEKNIEENYVKVDDYNILVNITNKLSRDVYKLTKSKADVEDVKALNEEVETLKTETDASIEAVKTDVDAKVGKFQRSTNLATILSFVALAVGTVALILK
ncbi:hypothetical protein AT15_07350 [Kosmotoga arenicorallina S304]|uniref:SLH domain-containing protein n=1 Tax=Kosmotoga arenicorallina S304 TaxID=1453497 RepID=A0A182C7M7_9BACT|nr:S-layer homology domain-containing protein [Kosmotoga arenicorallina]OAA31304.1 hypothetical protein AT15_07350 [Kosmotoga arenicorallina S304]